MATKLTLEEAIEKIAELEEVVQFYGEQLITVKAKNALLKQKLINKRVS